MIGRTEASEPAGENNGDTLALFRAVKAEELRSIQTLQSFTNPIGIETKYFSTTLAGAQSFALQAAAAFGEGPFSFIETRIASMHLVAEMRVTVDIGIPTVVLSDEHLTKLEQPIILMVGTQPDDPEVTK